MDPSIALELKNINKTFKIEVEDDLKGKSIFNRHPTKIVENKVLDDISISVKKGELLGIIGLNGSGKSTLLSIMARIMEPDSGTIEVKGKVSSILELGMGFHADLSGRENIYIKGEMYGFTKAQIDERIDSIIDFAGIRSYIDNPLRTYSSGMSGRLAFSIMVNVDADIMLLDEIMSTGDASFTAKADNLFKRQLRNGKTVVFASQMLEQLEQFCTRVIWINEGKIVADGPAKSICAMFRNSINDSVELITDFANNGIADAQYKLAILYRDGSKVGKNERLYKMWMEEAASQGHPQAQVVYADMLMSEGTERGMVDAFALYHSAAMKGSGEAKLKLSALSNNSDNAKDLEEIRRIMKQLAEIGHPINKFQYGMLMLRTAWNNSDKEEAIDWLMKSADEGNPDAMFQLAIIYRDGNGIAKNLEKYVEFLTKGAEIGHSECIRVLAEAYLQGKLIAKDEIKAFELYRKGAHLGIGDMQYQLAVMYRDGVGTEKNKDESDQWFTVFSNSVISNYQIIAAEQLKLFPVETNATMESLLQKAASTYNLRAINYLGALYRGDYSNAPNNEESKRYYEMAANWPGTSRLALADMYYKGIIFKQDYEKAASLYTGLTYCCDANIDYRLYLMYHNGLGFMKNDELSMKYLKRSATRGNRDAIRELRKYN